MIQTLQMQKKLYGQINRCSMISLSASLKFGSECGKTDCKKCPMFLPMF